MSKNKKNPVIHLRESDIRRIKKETTDAAIRYAFVLFLNVMRDYEGYGPKRLQRVYDGINDLSDSVSKGYCNMGDLERVLKDEANIHINVK